MAIYVVAGRAQAAETVFIITLKNLVRKARAVRWRSAAACGREIINTEKNQKVRRRGTFPDPLFLPLLVRLRSLLCISVLLCTSGHLAFCDLRGAASESQREEGWRRRGGQTKVIHGLAESQVGGWAER